jgi:hypothetical protein
MNVAPSQKPTGLSWWDELKKELNKALYFVHHYLYYFFSSHRQARLNQKAPIQPILEKLDLKRIHLCMRDVFILSRSYEGDLDFFLTLVHSLREVLDVSQSRPNTALDCQELLNKLHNTQKNLVALASKLDEMIDYFQKDARLYAIAQAIKTDCHHIFDHCNVLIRKINQLELSFLKKH